MRKCQTNPEQEAFYETTHLVSSKKEKKEHEEKVLIVKEN